MSDAVTVIPLVDDPLNPWRSMDRAPKNATWIDVKVALIPIGGSKRVDPNSYPCKLYRAHWADGGGEEQPPFIGWFQAVYRSDGTVSHFSEIPEPYAWRPIKE